jgi:hypothetical protein
VGNDELDDEEGRRGVREEGGDGAETVSTHTVESGLQTRPVERTFRVLLQRRGDVLPVSSKAGRRGCFQPWLSAGLISQSGLQRRDKLREACLRGGFRLLETLAEGKHDVESEIVLAYGVLCFRVVLTQEFVPADAIRSSVRGRKRKAQEVCREPSEIEPRVRPPAVLEAIKVEDPVDAVMDAIPAQRTVNRSDGRSHPGGRSLLVLLNAVTETIHEIRSGGKGAEG